MQSLLSRFALWASWTLAVFAGGSLSADDAPAAPRAFIDGTGPGWETLEFDDFISVNGDETTWTTGEDMIHCSGQPVGVTRFREPVANFEMVLEWRHLRAGGNSGVFVWVGEAAVAGLPPGKLPPGGIEVQILDHAYAAQYEARTGKTSQGVFSTNGDVFAVGTSTMTPFEPLSSWGQRSLPRKNLSKGVHAWNHYYIRALNGEVRLWVNGEEVSGGTDCRPRTGFLCLESEGAPIDFRNIRLRRLP